MIIVKLIGGLGNQLFQIAYAIELASQYKCKIVLDISSYKKYKIREFSLNNFKLSDNIDILNKNDLTIFENIKYKFSCKIYHLWQKLMKLSGHDYHFGGNMFRRLSRFGYFYNFDNYYHKISTIQTRNIYLYGYFQSEKYFISRRHEVFSCLKIKCKITPSEQKFINLIKSDLSIAISARLGDDYLNSKILNVCDGDFYAKGFDYFFKKYPGANFFIFSDDINRAKQIFKLKNKLFFIEGFSDYQSLRLMSCCDHFLISNSSFSWWGAYLAKNKNKEIISPNSWYKNINGNVDIYNSEMTKLNISN